MQSAGMSTNSTILLLVLSISCLCSTRDVYIQPSEGEHCHGTCYNITTFGKMAKNFSNSSGLVVHFLEGTHLLDLRELVVFTNLTNAVFEASDGRMEQDFHETVWQSIVVIKCTEHSSTGIAFVNSSNITFRYITITNCGADMTRFFPNAFHAHGRCVASLGYIYVSSNITLNNASVQNGSGSGLLVAIIGSDLTITNSSFAHNGLESSCFGGSNVAVVYADPVDCAPQDVYKALILDTTITLGVNGTNLNNQFRHIGGGLLMLMLQTSYSVAIMLDSVVAYGNKENSNIYIAAGIVDLQNYNLTIINSHIFNAHGKGLVIDNFQSSSDPTKFRCHRDITSDFFIIIGNSKFIQNRNGEYGSLTIFFGNIKYAAKFFIVSTEISSNIVTKSACALYISSYAGQSQLYVTLSNVTVTNNSKQDLSNYSSAVCANFVTQLVLDNVKITNNNMTGLSVHRTFVIANGTSVFHNNTGTDGGGLAMYVDSHLMFNKDSFLNFTNNSAKQRGGAIFVDSTHTISCFFQYDYALPKFANPCVVFFRNKADEAGTVLFGGDINNCLIFITRGVSSSVYFNKTFNYSAQTGPSVISSEPTDVCFCDDNNTINCSQKELTKIAYPGAKINISVVTVGQNNGVAPGIVEIKAINSSTSSIDTILHKTIAKKCTIISFAPIHDNYVLSISGYGHTILNIARSNCPLGFKISNKTSWSCDCEELRHTTTTITCDATTITIARLGNIWIGNISDCVVVYTHCPFDYCNTAWVNFSLTDPDPQCALNRTGILCGRCQDGLSLALGSNNCIQCPQFSCLALIIPFAAAGFGLVALLMVSNLTVSIGTINGLIFYASIVKISESTGIFFPYGSIPVLSQFIAWLNLDLGIETCFYHGITAYAKVWLQFVFPLYIWFIIATIIVLCRYSTWLSNKIGGNVVQVLATLILLSFTKIFRTFAPALTWIKLSCERNPVWYVDGNVSYFSPEHYILMAAAVLFLLLAVPYTLALLFDAVIEKYLTRIEFFRRQWIKFKPFVDAYHGPYKDNCRFWTGLLLLVRMAFTLVSLHLDTYATLVFITTSTSVLLSLMVFFGGIYQNSYLNILECLSLLNLAMLSAIYNPWYDSVKDTRTVVTIISVSVALVMFIGVLIYHMFLRVKKFKCFKRLAIKKFNSEESERLFEDEDYVYERLVQPTSTDVWMKRESLIYS